jgi:cysteine desulfurase/selenocysteine lyase
MLMDKMGVACRSGQMCSEPVMERFSVESMLRASFAVYNTLDDAEVFIKSLRRAISMLS